MAKPSDRSARTHGGVSRARVVAGLVAMLATAGALLAPRPALAQATEVTCASDGGRKVECDMDTRGRVTLKRQLSRAPCVEDQSWGLSRSSVWVKDGCRGVFVNESASSYGAPPPPADLRGDSASLPDEVTCASDGGRQVECPMNTRGRVRMTKQLSRAPCVEDRSWGLARSGVWVKDGCRASFARDTGNGYDSLPPPSRRDVAPRAAVAACNDYSRRGYDGEVLSTSAQRPPYWEVILKFDNDRYVCNVTSSGQVQSFERLR
ncbi:MAG: DUF3011 domain-containing protein [Steroidobacteraceae bacterium]|jgi:hypothetical protein